MSAPPDELPGPTRRRVRPWRLALSLLMVAIAAAATLPDLLGLDRRGPFAQLVAFRPALLAGLLVVTGAAIVVAGMRRRGWTLAGGLLAVALVGSSLVLPRAIPELDVPEPDALARPALTVLSFNTFEGRADVNVLADLIRSTRPDLVALPESGRRFGDRLLPLIPDYRFVTSQEKGRDVQGVSALTRIDLGDVTATIDRSTPFPSVELRGGGLGSTRFVAFHSVAPTPGDVPQWSHDLGTLDRWCANRDAGQVIIAGDFNATLDHSVFRDAISGCLDAAERTGNGLTGTWPTRLPRAVGTQIDHVLATGGVTVESFSVHDIPGSDHRAVLSRLLLR
jgi:endonuclease/exonuclease/phosphatase (EEP) superfamily protein YafD